MPCRQALHFPFGGGEQSPRSFPFVFFFLFLPFVCSVSPLGAHVHLGPGRAPVPRESPRLPRRPWVPAELRQDGKATKDCCRVIHRRTVKETVLPALVASNLAQYCNGLN